MRRCDGKCAAQLVAGILVLSVAVASAAPPARPPRPRPASAEVAQAIANAKAYLYGEQKNGNWEEVPARDPDGGGGGEVRGAQWGGRTAIATYALLAAGEDPKDPRIAQAIEFLKTADMIGIYAIGVRCQVWLMLQKNGIRTDEIVSCLKKDANALAQAAARNQTPGLFRYRLMSEDWDLSCAQYGVLGLWALEQCGAEIPAELWAQVEKAWLERQNKEGWWPYDNGTQDGKPSMTAAGIATLFITQEYLHLREGLDCDSAGARNAGLVAIDAGLKWMAAHFNDINDYYSWYGVERIGVASGLKYFGTVDWFAEGAAKLVKDQHPDGAWDGGLGGPVPSTAFGLLFLARGGAPVVMNKLEYAIDGKPGNWGQRARDCANVVWYIGDGLERDLNWQIVNLTVPVEQLHDAPILYISGNQELKFTAAEEEKLKLFVEQGGLILGNANCAAKAFTDGFRKLGGKLFPDYEFRELPKDHPLYAHQQYKPAKWARPPQKVLGLSNGARELMILLPNDDVSKAWQMNAFKSREELFQFMANIFSYAEHVDMSRKKDQDPAQSLRGKGDTHIITLDATIAATGSIKVARLQYKGNWNPEPGGWKRLGAWMHNERKTDLAVTTIELGAGKLDKSYPVAHLTGTGRLKLSDAERAELKSYVENGGTLVIDAAGGDSEFRTAAEAQIAEIWPGGSLDLLKGTHAIYTSGQEIKAVAYTNFSRTVGLSGAQPRLKAWMAGGRPKVIYSGEDLSVGLVGNPVDGIAGYEPRFAVPLMGNVLQWAAAGGAGAPASAPASQPASVPTK